MDARELDPYDFDAAAHAYEAIRQAHDDVAAIARHSAVYPKPADNSDRSKTR